ncbi:thioredoxin reductase 1, cytoplasmic-like [Ahaetulla prasina]|uniref:thioredoxin reductase 1, cytoplasmic-like n=1 Tax=Ahaetulla prasina TaxID=499056 RepID=UPI00264729B6|nr:thioredoxin reductase 1, cytoplasmic-like [Ahaetulla prasina]
MGNSVGKGKVVQQAPEEQRNRATPFEATKNTTQKAFQIHGKGKNVEAAINKKDWKLAIQTLIDENNVMIFSNTTCEFCAKVKDLFKSMGVSYFVLELDQIGHHIEKRNVNETLRPDCTFFSN